MASRGVRPTPLTRSTASSIPLASEWLCATHPSERKYCYLLPATFIPVSFSFSLSTVCLYCLQTCSILANVLSPLLHQKHLELILNYNGIIFLRSLKICRHIFKKIAYILIQGPTNTFIFWCPFGTLASKFWWPGSQIQWPKKKMDTSHTFFLSAPLVSVDTVCRTDWNALPHAMAVETIVRDASRIHFGILWLCLLILSFIITCFRPFPPALKTKLTQTH